MDNNAQQIHQMQQPLRTHVTQVLESILLLAVPTALFVCAALRIEAAAGLTLFIAVVGVMGMMAN